MDLAPSQLPRQGKPFDALFSENNLEFFEPRDREFQWSDDEPIVPLSVMERCASKILIGLENGEIKIFNVVDLNCKKILSHSKLKAAVTCLQCTCTEVIACYKDSSACIWNIQTGDLMRRFCVGNRGVSNGHARLLRVKGTNLAVGKEGCTTVGIWNYENSSVKFVSEWTHAIKFQRLEIHGAHVILMDSSYSVSVYSYNGTLVHRIGVAWEEKDMGIYGDYVIVGNKKGKVGIWDVNTLKLRYNGSS